MVIVQPDDWDNPSPNLATQEFNLNVADNQVLHVPGNFATGFKALEPACWHYYPEDVHAPMIGEGLIKKLVVKVKL